MSKMQNLQQALKQKPVQDIPAAAANQSAPEPAVVTRQAGRVGQINISAWLSPDFKTSLRLVQAAKGPSSTLQDILAEALNDLFAKYNVPTIRQD